MHEFSIATSLVDTLLEFAQKNQAQGKLLEVHLKIGKLRAISIEQLKFSYRVLAKDQFLSGSRLIVEETPALLHCPKCGFSKNFEVADDSYHFALPSLSCPKCGATVDLEGGDEVVITKVRIKAPSKK
ncbi:MAG: hydrogenase maturation nickel metallochaperone HypA [Candidatus Bathyarchaeia archaeon]|jgi:hydrogenase nickel insertion protein HypA